MGARAMSSAAITIKARADQRQPSWDDSGMSPPQRQTPSRTISPVIRHRCN
jgi:hypothetical protein